MSTAQSVYEQAGHSNNYPLDALKRGSRPPVYLVIHPLDKASVYKIPCAHTEQTENSRISLSTIQDLRTHLQWAVQVELTTIPTYLYAMYSIKDPSSESAEVFRSVVIEEMLHVALASNLLVAVGGQPKFYHRDILPKYPDPVPHHREGFTVNLERASKDYVRDTCMAIELPEEPGAIPEDNNFDPIGQFYLALENCFRPLARIHRRRASGQCPEVDRGCSCESGIMVLKQQSRPQNKEHPIDATTQPSRSHPNRV